METAEFSVPTLDQARQALDLSNILNSMKGVASVDVDSVTHSVSVQYDAGYTGRRVLHDAIRRSGYPLDDGEKHT